MNNDSKKIQEYHKYGIDPRINQALADALNEENDVAVLSLVKNLSANDIVDFLTTASKEQRERFARLYNYELNPDILRNMDESLLNSFIDILGYENTAKTIMKLRYDDIVYVTRLLNEEAQQKVVEFLPTTIAKMLNFVWSFPEESAGRLIQKDVLAISYDWNVETALNFLRHYRNITEDLFQIFVVNDKGCPIGAITLSRLFFTDGATKIADIINKNIKIIRPDIDQEEVVYIFRKYDLISAPVVDDNGVMIGYISYDDITEVMGSEIEKDIYNLGGILENDMHSNALQTAKSRFPWLFMNIAMATITSSVIGFFDDTIKQIVILAALMPIIASTGGNAGIQSVTVVIRGLVKREITRINLWRVVAKEVFSAFISGSSIAIASLVVLFLLLGDINISIVFSASIITVFVFSSFLGTIVPLLLDFFKVDPAIASSIIVTTCTDISSYGVFLGLATLFLV